MLFYVIVFGLLAVFVVVVGVSRMRASRRGRSTSREQHAPPSGYPHESSEAHETSHHTHTSEAARRSRKAKRAESQRDRRKRK